MNPQKHMFRLFAFVFCALAGGLALWMAFGTIGAGNLPPGCGEGGGCADVLRSPWSRWHGVSVAWGAAGVHAALIFSLLRQRPATTSFLAAAALGGSVWFIFLQALVIGAWCLFCMVDHGLGMLGAVFALAAFRPHPKALAGGCVAALLFAGLHVAQPRPLHLLRSPVEGDADFRGPDGRRGLAVLDGSVVLDVSASPVIGDPDAARLLVVMVDYACPHCRTLHHELVRHQEAHPGEVAVLVLPTPLHPSCNPLIDEAPERFRNSCEITLLSLGLFHTDAEAWAAFDLWLFEPPLPRGLREVEDHLKETLGQDPAALRAHPAARADMERNLAVFAALPVDDPRERRLPALLAVGHPPVIGPAGRIDRLPHLQPPGSPE